MLVIVINFRIKKTELSQPFVSIILEIFSCELVNSQTYPIAEKSDLERDF